MTKLLVIAIYFSIIIAIGLLALRKINTSKDFMLGGRRFSALTTALGAGAADMSGWLMIGFPGLIYLSGVAGIWMAVGLIIGAYLNWHFVAKRLRIETQKYGNAVTVAGYISNKLKDKSGIIKIIIAVMTAIFFVIYITSALVALSLLINTVFPNLGYIEGLWISAIFIFIYTSIGGFVAINWIDVLQGLLMLGTLLIVPFAIIINQDGFANSYNALQAINVNIIDPFSNLKTITIISLLSWGIGYYGQPHILVRFMAIKKPKTLALSKNICMTWMVLSIIGAFCIGLFGKLLFSNKNINPETIFLLSADKLFPAWFSGIILAAVLAAIMSTVSAQLHATACSITKDILSKFNKNLNNIWVIRAMMLLIILTALSYAHNPNSTVLGLVAFAWAGLGSAFGPVTLFSLYSKKMTKEAALYGIIIGGATVLIWHFCKRFGGIFELQEIIPGFIFSSIAIIIKNRKTNSRI
ncbi:MAG: sodium/proline symporter [Rickettsiales bacterium]|nr:sodium/proline symporter [Rickettsiales bacterium]